MTDRELMIMAEDARKRSYSPYSGFAVGAALLTQEGKVYTGCNIENASFSPTCCAERVAFFTAVSAGERKFEKIAIVGGKANVSLSAPCPPCGVCRQVMSEFCDGDFTLLLGTPDDIHSYTLADILPLSFELK
ncbi:MAG: cytidine deaminase [Ruminococcaceae bacterium]|nr:cytidine deaminase [Oscillospiraceae bacterium]